MGDTWIISANAGRARFFSQAHADQTLKEIDSMVNTAVHLRTSETEADRIGQRSASKSRHSVGAPTQPSGYQPNQTPDEHQTELFARDIADFLLQAQQEGRFRQLCLIASPEFLGVLRKLLDPGLVGVVRMEINKDYTQFSPRQLQEQIQAYQARE